jgi:cytochrome c-type biogenesis protein CcmH
MRKSALLWLLVLVMLPSIASYASKPDEPIADPSQESRAVAIGQSLRCVVCQSESINDSQADMARDMRQLVRDRIKEGWTDQQIYDYARARYGDFILLRPPFQTNTWLLWLAPLLFLVLAGSFVFLFLKRKDKRANTRKPK